MPPEQGDSPETYQRAQPDADPGRTMGNRERGLHR